MGVFVSRKRFILGLVVLVLVAAVVVVGFVVKDRRDDEARCHSIRQQTDSIGNAGKKLMDEANSIANDPNADQVAKDRTPATWDEGSSKVRTAAHLTIDNKTCFSPSYVAYAKTALDNLDTSE